MTTELTQLGWNTFFQAQLDVLEDKSLLPARVVGEERNTFSLDFGNGQPQWGEISGRFHFDTSERSELPATGDWVAAKVTPGAQRAVIHHVFKRQTCLARIVAGNRQDDQILATNVDTVFIASSLNAELNLKRIERYLTLAWDSGAVPVVLLTKADLVTTAEDTRKQVQAISAGVEVHVISVKSGAGIDALQGFFQPAKTLVLLGSSGVGKSTLANRLMGKEILKTQETGVADKGRHTTTARYLFRLPSGALLIDTPGMRELQMGENTEGLALQFADIEALGTQCKFTDCQHENQPGCAIRAAIAAGELPRERMDNYEKLQKEMRVFSGKTKHRKKR